jgi:thiamine biosynthesis lipoprotein ApbE
MTDNGTAGDALDNIFYVLGAEQSRMKMKRFAACEVFFFLPAANNGWKLTHVK